MGNGSFEKRETLPSWLKAADVTAWIYAAVAVFGYLGLSIYADVKGAKESYRLQRGKQPSMPPCSRRGPIWCAAC